LQQAPPESGLFGLPREHPVSFIEGENRSQVSLLPLGIDDYIALDSLVRVLDAFVESLDLSELGFERTIAASTGRPGFRPA
jgi:transposase